MKLLEHFLVLLSSGNVKARSDMIAIKVFGAGTINEMQLLKFGNRWNHEERPDMIVEESTTQTREVIPWLQVLTTITELRGEVHDLGMNINKCLDRLDQCIGRLEHSFRRFDPGEEFGVDAPTSIVAQDGNAKPVPPPANVPGL